MCQPMKSFVPLIAAILLAACAGTPQRQAQQPQTLEERALARWQHLIDGEPELAWDYLSPGFRATTSREVYAAQMATRPVRWISARVIGTECESEDVCEVQVEVGVSVQSHVTGVGRVEAQRAIREGWIRSGGQWFNVPR